MRENKETALTLLHRLHSLRLIEFTKFSPELREALRADIQELCGVFSVADSVTRADIVSHVGDGFAFAFLWFAKIMAEKAVQQSAPGAIWDGLMALLIENFERDYRDTLRRLVLLYHSATKLGLSAQELFTKASNLAVGSLAAKLVHDFPLRAAGGRSLGVFRYEETGSGASFAYRRLGSEEAPF